MDDWWNAGRGVGAIDVPALLDGPAGNALHEMCGTGALIGLFLTRDGGALGVSVTVDSVTRREYFHDSESLAGWLDSGLDPVRAAVAGVRPPSASGRSVKRVRAL